MAERAGPKVYTIAAHRGFADALAAGLLSRYGEEHFGLARLTLLLPSQRAARTITEAFVRLTSGGLLLPRMAVAGDLDLDEALGSLLDPLGAGTDIPPAADPLQRWLRLAHYLRVVEGEGAGKGAGLLRRAFEVGRTIDRLLVEEIMPIDLLDEDKVGIVRELSQHWQRNTASFLKVQTHWLAELSQRGEIDPPARRNALFDRAAARWMAQPPAHPIIAAGVTSASPALARLLRAVSQLPQGGVVLPDLDLEMDEAVWTGLGTAGAPAEIGDPPIGGRDAVTHPQYHLKLLLNRMGVARSEVQPWHRSGLAASPPDRNRAISNLFLPPGPSATWAGLPAAARRLSGVRLMESANPGEEAQAIALLIREAIEVPEKRVALVTPDRGLAGRVVAELQRWGIAADDTAGRPLPQTAAGRLLLLLAEVMAEQAAPVALVALLTHPLVHKGEGRPQWLESARRLDLVLRGPRPAPGLDVLRSLSEKAGIGEWWAVAEEALAPVLACVDETPLADLFDLLASAGEALCGESLWQGAEGRALAAFVEDMREAARTAGTMLDPRELHAVLRDAMDRIAVRPPWGGHPRIAIYGLLEARMARAELVICAGLVEGVWPGSASPDALLPPAVLRALGVPGADFRIGLAAHDLAAALGAPEVLLSWARRDEGAPTIPSRFILRIKAMLGDDAKKLQEVEAVRLARQIDHAEPAARYPRPCPMPSAEQRKVDISVTGLDRLRSDPYQFYASAILHLKKLDGLDEEPSAAWKGIAVHAILEEWHRQGGNPGELVQVAHRKLDEMNAHPLMRGLWRPRLLDALNWIDNAVIEQREGDGRVVLQSEVWGDMRVKGVRIHGRADRIDRMADGTMAIVDYKTGEPPSPKMVSDGYALQLGLIGLMVAGGGFKEVAGEPTAFEYWSLGKNAKSKDKPAFGFAASPFRKAKADEPAGLSAENFLEFSQNYLTAAIDRWILGSDPFTARLNPDLPVYGDYDQLMRLDEWLFSLSREELDDA